MSSQPQLHYTPQEYIAVERKAEYKNEFFAGEILPVPKVNERHNLITVNTLTALHVQFKNRPCTVYASRMRVKVNPTGLYTYPDVVSLCDKPQFDDVQKDTLLNPTVIIEVLSPSTEAYDRGGKFGHYRKLASLVEYVLISQDQPHIEHYIRQADNQWLLSEASHLQDSIHLPSIDCPLVLAEVYEKVELSAVSG